MNSLNVVSPNTSMWFTNLVLIYNGISQMKLHRYKNTTIIQNVYFFNSWIEVVSRFLSSSVRSVSGYHLILTGLGI